MKIQSSELPLNADGSVYHLNLLPQDIGETIFLVGDPGRVPLVSQFFDEILVTKQKREFITHTGWLQNKKVSVLSTGIGTDNIDIVLNELDALVNIDLKERSIKKETKSLKLIRLGTSGSLNPEIKVGDFILSQSGIGFDGMMNFYPQHQDSAIKEKISKGLENPVILNLMYAADADNALLQHFKSVGRVGVTGSLSGFYGPQGRQVRLKCVEGDFLADLNKVGIDNFEMETSAIYALSKLLGHQALSINCIIANRTTGKFLENYQPKVKEMIQKSLYLLQNF
ncbi:Uridine phosphorylase [Candidatus Ornithobacterium hominis]|uniref:nucleoside phosphorylase n=1 Tax=Candidatus Ornithobacterium hominis TaxID=2497989 RepID=UPI0024BC814C|nr:nucleoside phosphorylase [Candidatus Ornithobacterium hominis]CAI9429981.1 Uridine phosphorylase [Candidatus Ornithobacterium hominis]